MGNLMMLLTALIWGFAFVAQKSAADIMGPHTFNAERFLLGATVLLVLLPLFKSSTLSFKGIKQAVVMGSLLFLGVATQQIGLITTTAGKMAFICGLYIILVPLISRFNGKDISSVIWMAAILALCGLYLLSFTGSTGSLIIGDVWALSSAVFFALHIITIEKAVRSFDPLRLSIGQFYTCAILSSICMFALEQPTMMQIQIGRDEILFTGVFSTAIAYTLQVIAQRKVDAHIAVLILSLEAVFGAIGGSWLLGEVMNIRMVVGAGMMLGAILLAQLTVIKPTSTRS